VLKRNRTLKVLNLSENKLDVPCLVIIAEALVGFSHSLPQIRHLILILEIQLKSGNARPEQESMFRARFGRGAWIAPDRSSFANIRTTDNITQIQSLRTAFTLNTALKRLFLSSTSMTSAGAIALAEFLPESTSLLHLDLTTNDLDIAGVMALSSGLKANHVMRCLDLNIPPGDEEFARSVFFCFLVYRLKGFRNVVYLCN